MDPIAPLHTRQKLRMLGFLENEITLLSLLFLKRKSSTKELSQQTSLSYDAVHYSLNILEKKKLIRRSSENGGDMVEVCSDTEFLKWIEDQKEKNSEIYDDAKNTIMAYFTNLGETTWKPNVMYFEGAQGVKDIYQDMLEVSEDIYCWTDIAKIRDTVGEEFMNDFIQQRIKKKITTHAILPETPSNVKRQQKEELRQTKFSNNLPIDGEIRIYGNKVAVITFQDSRPVGFVFSGNVISSVFKAIFEHAWQE